MDEKTRKFGRHVIQYAKEYSLCTGCHSCEVMCSLVHDGVAGPDYGRIKCEFPDVSVMLYTVHSCLQCEDHPCYEACPKKDVAMKIDEETGVVYVVEDECIGCGKCARNCAFQPSRINMVKSKDRKKRKAKKCDLCRGRENGPACIEHCPVRCLGLSDEPLPYDPETLEYLDVMADRPTKAAVAVLDDGETEVMK